MKGGYFLRIVKLIQRNLLLLCQVAFTILPLCTKVLCYTSVTCLVSQTNTGNPKGVMLSHGNVVADFAGFLKVTDVSVVFIASVAAFLYHTVLFHLFFF